MTDSNLTGRRVLVVLGMHRSGTSAFARCLNLLGAGIGERLVPANWGNERGFWEDEEVVAADAALLEALGFVWHDLRPLPPRWWASEAIAVPRRRVAEIARTETTRHRLWVVKDPRLCRLLPVWRTALAEVGCEPCYLLALRNPAEVAASQARRDGFSARKSNLLWLRHVLEAELHTRGARRVVVRYAALLADWRSALERAGRELDVEWPIAPDIAAPSIEDFLSRELQHFHLGDRQTASDPDLSRWVRESYEALRDAAAGDWLDATGALDRVRCELEAADRLFAPALDELGAAVAELRSVVESEHAGWAGALTQLDAQRAEVERQVAELAAQRAELGRWAAEVEALRGELGQRAAEVEALRGELGRRAADIEALRAVLGQRESELEEARRVIAAERARGEREAKEHRALQGRHAVLDAKAHELAGLAEVYQSRRAIRLIERFHRPGDLSAAVAPAFRQLLDDSRLFGGSLRGLALVPSESLRRVAALVYPLRLGRSGLAAVLLAPALDLSLSSGTLAVEILSAGGEVLRRAEVAAAELREDLPVRFAFAPLADAPRARLALRVIARGADAPLRIFEWRRSRLAGLGPRLSRAFAAFEFVDGDGGPS